MLNTYQKGVIGEEIAENFLLFHDYEIVAKNYRKKFGEIDLIAFKKKTIVFIEVRLKSSGAYGLGEESITWTKRKRLRKVAEAFLCETNYDDCDIRFDVVGIQTRDFKGFYVRWLVNVEL